MRTLRGPAVGVEVEHDPLTLAQHPEERALERVGREHELLAVGVAHDDALVGGGVEHLHGALHARTAGYALTTLPAFRHEVQTFTRLGEPLTIARTRWMFGFQRRLVRRCEWLSLMPKIGFLPHTSQTEDIAEHL